MSETFYQFDPETNEFLFSGQHERDPRASKKAGHDVYPKLGKHQVSVPPPKPKPGKAIVWLDGEWAYEPDHRGETWWDEDDKEVVIDALGDPADEGLTDEAPPPPPPTAEQVIWEGRRRKWALVGSEDETTFNEIKQRGSERAIELLDIRIGQSWTTEEAEEAAYLRALQDSLQQIDLIAFAMSLNPPTDYQEDYRWQA